MKSFTIIGALSLAVIQAVSKAAAIKEWNRRTNGETIYQVMIGDH